MERVNVKRIVTAGAMGAVTVIMALTPLGMIPWFGGVSLTIMHIPTIVAAVLEGPAAGTAVGLIFGVTSLVKAAITPNGPLDPLFMNPLVSVLPRLMIGAVTWLVFKAFKGRLSPLASGVAGAAGAFTNTVFVLFMLYVVAARQVAGIFGVETGALPKALAGIAFSNGLLEAAAAAVFTSAIVSAWKGIEGAKGRSRLSDEDK